MKHCPTCGSQVGELDLDEGGVVGREHPQSSRDAARIANAGSQLARILALIDDAGQHGLNAAELVGPTGLTISVLGTRLKLLRDRSLICYLRDENGDKVVRQGSCANTTSDVHVATVFGAEELDRLGL